MSGVVWSSPRVLASPYLQAEGRRGQARVGPLLSHTSARTKKAPIRSHSSRCGDARGSHRCARTHTLGPAHTQAAAHASHRALRDLRGGKRTKAGPVTPVSRAKGLTNADSPERKAAQTLARFSSRRRGGASRVGDGVKGQKAEARPRWRPPCATCSPSAWAWRVGPGSPWKSVS